MEQYSQYLMSVMKNSKSILMNPCSSHYSWEEQAFAEDARGPLGGFVWPPRSYSCSFCRREFRSAQALGGHMNVHRREKAKLKQSVNANTLTTPQNHNDKESLCESFDPGFFPSRVSSMPALGSQESLDSSSDTKSCVYDGDFLVAHGNVDVETNLVLGFDLDSCSNEGVGGKRRKTNHDTTPIMAGSVDTLDLELRLAS